MTDERFVYTSDIRERKGMANGARGVKNGSRSKACSLPSDGMSAAQWKKQNGPVENVQLGQPMSWAELKKLKPHLQYLYLDYVVNHYKARRVDLLEMLGVSTATFWKFEKTLPSKLNYGGGARKVSPEFEAFIAGDPQNAPDAPTVAQDAPTEQEAASASVEPQEATQVEQRPVIVAGSVTVCGSANDALAALLRLVKPSVRYKFTVSFEEDAL